MGKDVAMEFKAMRKSVLFKGISSFLIAVILCLIWTLLYLSLINNSGFMFLGGWAVIAAIWYFGIIWRLEKKIVCPACGESLTDIDGWGLFESECPHCHVSYKRNN